MQTFRDVYQERFILSALVAKELKAMYRNMALGFLWSLLNPLIMVAVLSFVLVYFLDMGREAPAMIVVALIPFNFFSYCLSGCTSSVTHNASLVKKVAFPRQILPISVIVTHLVHYAIQSILIVGVLFLFPPPHVIFSWNLLWLAPVFVVQLGLCVGLGLLTSGLHVLYRDVQYIVDSALTVLFWLSPVLYDAKGRLESFQSWVYYLYYLNPLSGILESYRNVLYHGHAPDPLILGIAFVCTLILGAIGVRVFWVHEHEFADLI